MKPRIVTHTPIIVVGMQIVTKPMSPEIPDLWSRFVQREQEIGGVLEPGATYGVMQMATGDAAGLIYLAGLSVVEQPTSFPTGMTDVTIPAGQYAVFEFSISEISSAYDFMLNSWLPTSGYTLLGSPMFERYGADFNPSEPSSRMTVHIPIIASASMSRSDA